MPETPTHLSLLSDSVMRTPALNELPDDVNQGNICIYTVKTVTVVLEQLNVIIKIFHS